MAAGGAADSSPHITDGKRGPETATALLGVTQQVLGGAWAEPRGVRLPRVGVGEKTGFEHQLCARHWTPAVSLNWTDLFQAILASQLCVFRQVNFLL